MRISICIPVYNLEHSIERCIRSALAQDYSDFEVIVTDNQSTDRTYEIAAAIKDPRLKVLRNEDNLGAYGNHNRLVELASGTWIKFLHGDDELLPHCLSRFAEFLQSAPKEVAMVSCGARHFDFSGNELVATRIPQTAFFMRPAPACDFLSFGNVFGTPTMVFLQRQKLIDAGGFDVTTQPNTDWDCWINLRTRYITGMMAEHLVLIRDDPREDLAGRIKHNTKLCLNDIQIILKWYKLDLRFAQSELKDTPYAQAICRQMFRYWESALKYLVQGSGSLFKTMFRQLGLCGMRGQTFVYYLRNKLALRGPGTLDPLPVEQQLKFLWLEPTSHSKALSNS